MLPACSPKPRQEGWSPSCTSRFGRAGGGILLTLTPMGAYNNPGWEDFTPLTLTPTGNIPKTQAGGAISPSCLRFVPA
ncbi:hypothetical protein [Dictyobacter aurantiacus]|uniref:hypothetical protein n=1 Tax=Dictyobacter aurantiacus TaxID=1936993 RepID=UPI000F836853|nr:hypothetical protein [Dictyobacter aurantiacus]